MKQYAVITTYNEEDNITELIEKLIKLSLNVIVVDDGSTDETYYTASLAGANTILTTGRIGIGPSLQIGWKRALELGADRIIQIDAGKSHNPGQALTLLQALDFSDMVIGTRFTKTSKYVGGGVRPLLSKIAARCCNFAVHGANFSDWTSGYRAFNRCALEKLVNKHYTAKMHSWQIQILAQACECGLRVVEIPIVYKAGKSSFNKSVVNEAIHTYLHILNHISGVKL